MIIFCDALACSETAYGRLFMISSSILTVLPDLPEASLIEYHYVVTDDYKHEFKTEMLELPPEAKNSSCNRALSLCSKHAENGELGALLFRSYFLY